MLREDFSVYDISCKCDSSYVKNFTDVVILLK